MTPESKKVTEFKNTMTSNTNAVDALYTSDVFRMYCFKVLPCTKKHNHNWKTCPFAHDGEKAARRDPRKHKYFGIECPDVKAETGECPRGDDCPYAHNVFEFWLHPTRYRTNLCNEPATCKRRVCFFAHCLKELREPTLETTANNKGIKTINSVGYEETSCCNTMDDFGPLTHLNNNISDALSFKCSSPYIAVNKSESELTLPCHLSYLNSLSNSSNCSIVTCPRIDYTTGRYSIDSSNYLNNSHFIIESGKDQIYPNAESSNLSTLRHPMVLNDYLEYPLESSSVLSPSKRSRGEKDGFPRGCNVPSLGIISHCTQFQNYGQKLAPTIAGKSEIQYNDISSSWQSPHDHHHNHHHNHHLGLSVFK